MLRVKINGNPHEFSEPGNILTALRAASVEIPTLCHDDRLRPYGGCRLCVVQVNGIERPVTACNTELADGMEIETHTPELQALRTTLLELLVREYPVEAATKFPEKEFHRLLVKYGLTNGRRPRTYHAPADFSHPNFVFDPERCIRCFRCVRMCDEVQGQFVWNVWNRGIHSSVRPGQARELLSTPCVSCGSCVDTCPTGALEDRTMLNGEKVESWTRTTCPYCGVGCELTVGTAGSQIIQIRPAFDAPVNRGHLCVKGRYAFQFVHAPDRITSPMIRVDGNWQAASWDEAIQFAAGRLRKILDESGPSATGVLGSSRATNEENYLTQKFARVVLRTNNVDCCARVCHTPTAKAMKTILGTGAATNSYNDIEKASLIMVCGANATENHPVIGARIKQAARRGAKLIVIDPRRIELAEYADLHLAVKPGRNVILFNAMACAIVEENLADAHFLTHRVDHAQEFAEFVRAFTPEVVAEKCGVRAEAIRQAARLYARCKPAMCIHGLGMTEHVQGVEGVMCMVNLALLTGNLGKPGSGINPLRGQNNVQGAAHMGCDPDTLTGGVNLRGGLPAFEAAWNTPLPHERGKNLLDMMDSAARGELKALWVIGYDILLTNSNSEATRQALSRLGLVIIQDLFMNETAREFGTVFFPAASSFEKEGTFMNAERRIQCIRRAIAPQGECKPDWEIISLLAQALGHPNGFAFNTAAEIWDEIRTVWPGAAGITWPQLQERGMQWPCPAEGHPGTTILHGTSFPTGTRASLQMIPFVASSEVTDATYPFLLTTGRTLYQFNAATMTARTTSEKLRPEDLLDINPADASQLHLVEGDLARVKSRHGETVLRVHLTSTVKQGELFTTFHTVQGFVNRVTSAQRDRMVSTPEYKATAVRVQRIPRQEVSSAGRIQN